jgi:kynureninase
MPQQVGDRLAPLIGAAPGEVAVHDSTTVNLYQLVDAACALRPERREIAIGSAEFPTDRYVVDGIARARGLRVRSDFDDLADVAVMVRSVVDYRSARVADVAGETARATAAGALAVWDLSHAAGVLAIDLGSAGAQLAVGCTYKYLNGGPGAPAFTYVAGSLQATLPQPIWGWFAQADQFDMGPTFTPQSDIRRVLLGTPSVLALAAADEGIAVTVEAGIDAVQAKARALTGLALELCDQFGFESSTPRDPASRGGHVAVHHPDARRLVAELAEHRVITDFRDPDIVRIGCSPLTTRFTDVYDGLTRLADFISAD